MVTPADYPNDSSRAVPQDPDERRRLRAAVTAYARQADLVPPLSMEELREHAEQIAAARRAERYRDFITVVLGGESWRSTVAAVPFERRILLLPQCLRTASECPADTDALGVLCEGCGRCPIGALQQEAERLGYVVLIAEGTTVVKALLEQGRVDAVIGVSCLEALEKSFPAMAAEAIPGMAVPLVRDGCDGTDVDVEWVQELIRLRGEEPVHVRVDLEALRDDVSGWFDAAALRPRLQLAGTRTEELALDWLAAAGKRWRPFLLASCFRALAKPDGRLPETVRDLALAVECFHKASLIHDDIEDGDDERYGVETLHRREGIPIALNVGDLLIGEGYRLIAEAAVSAARRARMLQVAALGHRTLCLGQGDELCWSRDPGPVGVAEVLEIFRRKTSPAFAVALQLGALAAGTDEETLEALRGFSDSLGVAYQIRDDLEDFGGPEGDVAAWRPSVVLSLRIDQGDAVSETALQPGTRTPASRLYRLVEDSDAPERASMLFEHYKNEAIRALNRLRSSPLKSLLRRVAHRILEKRPGAVEQALPTTLESGVR